MEMVFVTREYDVLLYKRERERERERERKRTFHVKGPVVILVRIANVRSPPCERSRLNQPVSFISFHIPGMAAMSVMV